MTPPADWRLRAEEVLRREAGNGRPLPDRVVLNEPSDPFPLGEALFWNPFSPPPPVRTWVVRVSRNTDGGFSLSEPVPG